MYYNPNIPLETALEMFEDDHHMCFEIIEDYHDALHEASIRRVERLCGKTALEERGEQ